MSFKSKIIVISIFVLLCAASCARQEQEQQDTLEIFGAITDASGKPAAGAGIKASYYPGGPEEDREVKTQSDAQGKYTLQGIPGYAKGVDILVDFAGFPSVSKSFRPGSYERGEIECDFVLEKGRLLTGRVTAAGKPVKDARIFFMRNGFIHDEQYSKTDADGFYKLHVKEGNCILWVDHEDFKVEYFKIVVKESEKTVKNISLEAGKSISGMVVDQEDRPVAGAEVRAEIRWYTDSNRETETDDSGFFRLKGLRDGKVRFSVRHKDYVEEREVVQAGAEGLKFTLTGARFVRGRVIDKESRRGLDAFTIYMAPIDEIYLMSQLERLKISPGGKFTTAESGAPGKKYHILVSAPGYAYRVLKDVDIFAQSTGEGIQIELSPGAVLKGRVLSKEGKPAAGAKIKEQLAEITGYGMNYFSFLGDAKSDEKGEFILDDVPAGVVKLSISHHDFQDFAGEAAAKGKQDAVIFRLEKGYSITGRVIRSHSSAAGLEIMAMQKTKDGRYISKSTRTDAAGKYALRHLEPGAYSVYVNRGEDPRRQHMLRYEEIKLVDKDVEFDFEPLGNRRLAGTVYLDGQPEQALIRVFAAADKNSRQGLLRFISDKDGRFDFRDLPAAPLLIKAFYMDLLEREQDISASIEVDLTAVKEKQQEILLKKTTRIALKAGQAAPLFKGKQVDGKPLNLRDFRGRIVLLDFWATWCGPCIAEIPQVKKLYETYKSKGLEIIGISLDNDRKAWEDYIKKEKLLYLHVLDTDAGKTKISDEYGVYYIPNTFLIDKKGIIQAVGLRGEELEKAVKKIFQ